MGRVWECQVAPVGKDTDFWMWSDLAMPPVIRQRITVMNAAESWGENPNPHVQCEGLSCKHIWNTLLDFLRHYKVKWIPLDNIEGGRQKASNLHWNDFLLHSWVSLEAMAKTKPHRQQETASKCSSDVIKPDGSGKLTLREANNYL